MSDERKYTKEEIRTAIILNHKEVFGSTESKTGRGAYFIVGFVEDSLNNALKEEDGMKIISNDESKPKKWCDCKDPDFEPNYHGPAYCDNCGGQIEQ